LHWVGGVFSPVHAAMRFLALAREDLRPGLTRRGCSETTFRSRRSETTEVVRPNTSRHRASGAPPQSQLPCARRAWYGAALAGTMKGVQASRCLTENAMITPTIVLTGILRADGTVELDQRPDIPPGPVQVVLRRVPRSCGGSEASGSGAGRLPDQPLEDEGVLVHFDLPRPAGGRPVPSRKGARRLPDGIVLDDTSS
jgi:hypothetical protein